MIYAPSLVYQSEGGGVSAYKTADCHPDCVRMAIPGGTGRKKKMSWHFRRRMRQSPITAVASAADGVLSSNASGVEEEGLLSSQAPPAIPGGTGKKEKPFIRFAH